MIAFGKKSLKALKDAPGTQVLPICETTSVFVVPSPISNIEDTFPIKFIIVP